MVVGNARKIDLGTSSFERIISRGFLYVDKTRFIEDFLDEAPSVQLIARQRRMGKSLNMDMLRCFLTDAEDFRPLFKGLYIEQSGVWSMAHSAPVFFFDFKSLDRRGYKAMVKNKIQERQDARDTLPLVFIRGAADVRGQTGLRAAGVQPGERRRAVRYTHGVCRQRDSV
jgi:hypothetical protein